MTAVRSVAAAAGELGNTFRGQLLEPGNAGYEEARKVHNGLVDKRPALIAQCADATDVADAIRLFGQRWILCGDPEHWNCRIGGTKAS